MSQPSVIIFVDYKNTPHAFIGLSDGAGRSEYFGFAPATPGSVVGVGSVGRGLATHEQGDPTNSRAGYIDDVAWSKEIPVTATQYSAMLDAVNAFDDAKHTYNVTGVLFGQNCTSFVKTVLDAVGVNYPGLSAGVNPMSLIPNDEQGPLFTAGPDGRKSLSDRVRDPLNTPGTPAYEFRQSNPEMFSPSSDAPHTKDQSTSELHQNSDGTYTEEISQNGEAAGHTLSIEYTASGEVSQVTESDGAGHDANYNTRTTTYDAEGRVDAIETVRDDDSRDVINLDQDGTQPWSRFEAHVDTEGREDFSVATMDDGSSVYSDFDQTGASGNSLWQSGTDAEGRVDWVKATTDEGAVNWVDYDQANAHAANRWESHIDSQGRVDWTSTVSEDGSTVRVDYDETGALDWARSEIRLDENGLIDYVNTFGDDGSSTWSDYDQGNTRGDSLYQVGTDAHGRTDWVNVTADDGSRNWLDYDQGNVDGSATWGSHIDAQGRTDWIEVTADDGTRHWLDYDQSGEHIWSSVETWFDPGGTKDQRTIHEDNGSRTHYEYFPEVHPDAHAITYFYPDGHGAGGRIIYDGYSHVLEINGGNNPEWPDSTFDSFNYSTDTSVDFRYAPEPYY
jgi:hypothetical protein